MAGTWCWDNYKKYFERKGYSCISPALRFHDLNPNDIPDPQLGTTSLLEYAVDLEEQLKEFEEPPILMGHSIWEGFLPKFLPAGGMQRQQFFSLLHHLVVLTLLTIQYSTKKFFRCDDELGILEKAFSFFVQ